MNPNNLFQDLALLEGKQRYQQFKCELGIDHVLVNIPLKEAAAFESAAIELSPTSRVTLIALVEQFNGSLEEVK
jgi:hypothetical protein